jgi:hypothetical protein
VSSDGSFEDLFFFFPLRDKKSQLSKQIFLYFQHVDTVECNFTPDRYYLSSGGKVGLLEHILIS